MFFILLIFQKVIDDSSRGACTAGVRSVVVFLKKSGKRATQSFKDVGVENRRREEDKALKIISRAKII
jgi:hypothetical protein